jgi:4-hydroxy-tetrahydrodipicolinate synthase
MRALRDAGLPLDTMLVGTGAAALADTVVLTKLALELGFGGALVIPPFYYKDVPEDGVFAYYAGLIERVGSDALRLYLYNFPKMSGVALTPSLVARLVEAFPRTLAGIKDSSGDMPYAETLHRAHPQLDVFPSSEATLVESRRAGFAGCISASANVTAPYCAPVWRDGDVELQAQLAAMRAAISAAPLIPAVRFLASELHRDPAWLRAMPPIGALSPAEQSALTSALRLAGYRAPSGSLA